MFSVVAIRVKVLFHPCVACSVCTQGSMYYISILNQCIFIYKTLEYNTSTYWALSLLECLKIESTQFCPVVAEKFRLNRKLNMSNNANPNNNLRCVNLNKTGSLMDFYTKEM